MHSSGVKDAFGYQIGNGITCKAIEINCTGGNCGDGTDNSSNGSTCHSGCKAIRVNGVYYNTHGGAVADTSAGTQSWNIGCTIGGNIADAEHLGSIVVHIGAEMWFDDCIAFGSQYSLWVESGGSAFVRNCRFFEPESIVGTKTEY